MHAARHIARSQERDRRTLDQLRARDIHIVMREIGSDICIERELVGRGWRDNPGAAMLLQQVT